MEGDKVSGMHTSVAVLQYTLLYFVWKRVAVNDAERLKKLTLAPLLWGCLHREITTQHYL